jgi:hypothetical protein
MSLTDSNIAETQTNCNPCHFKPALESFFTQILLTNLQEVDNINCMYLLSDSFGALTKYLGDLL